MSRTELCLFVILGLAAMPRVVLMVRGWVFILRFSGIVCWFDGHYYLGSPYDECARCLAPVRKTK